jgi:hypothetical protein
MNHYSFAGGAKRRKFVAIGTDSRCFGAIPMHLLVIVAAFAFVAVTPFMQAVPRDGVDLAQTPDETAADDQSEES